jgi:hypothetical protein
MHEQPAATAAQQHAVILLIGVLGACAILVSRRHAMNSPRHLAVEVAVHDHAHKARPVVQGVICDRVVCEAVAEGQQHVSNTSNNAIKLALDA